MFDYTIYRLKLRSDIEFLQPMPDNSDKKLCRDAALNQGCSLDELITSI